MTQNHEQFTAVWLDSKYADCDQTSCDRRAQLSPIINYNVKFSDADECLDYIKTIQTESIVFITCGSQGQKLVPNIYHFPQLLYIYIYCFNKVEHEEWALNKNYASKIRGVFTDIDLLLAKINDDVKLSLKNILPLNIFHKYDDLNLKEMSMKDLNKQSAQFMWFQLLIDTLLHGDYSDTAKDDMFYECVAQYDGNEIELKRILDFYKTYIAEQAISWYTRNSFLYRLLNKAFRIQNINIIYKFRYFIKHLYNQLRDVQLQQSEDLSSITVYRGQLMHHDEFDNFKENVGELISINTFFSTTLQSQVALNFTGNGDFKSAIEITRKSLTTLGISENHPIRGIMHSNLGLAYLRCCDYTLAMENFEKALQIQFVSLPADHLNIATTYNNIATIYFESEENYERALENYEKALEIQLRCLPSKADSEIALTYNNIGSIYYRLENYSLALENYKKSVEIMTKCLPENHFDFSIAYNNIGLIYAANGNYTEALINYNKALSTSTSDHPFSSRTYLNIGDVYRMTENNNLALEHYEKALEIQMQCSTQNHHDLLRIYNVMNVAYYDMNNREMSLKYYEKFLEILLIVEPLNFNEHSTAYENIADLLFLKNDFKAALEYYNKAIEAAEKTTTPSLETIEKMQKMIRVILVKLTSASNELKDNPTELR
ncbi:unnamed protein product [Rotaria socialis]